MFTPDTVEHYRAALARLGHGIPEPALRVHYREAGRYVGFKYMGVALRG